MRIFREKNCNNETEHQPLITQFRGRANSNRINPHFVNESNLDI